MKKSRQDFSWQPDASFPKSKKSCKKKIGQNRRSKSKSMKKKKQAAKNKPFLQKSRENEKISNDQNLSEYFKLFVKEKKATKVSQKYILIKFLKTWRHHFAGSLYKKINMSKPKPNKYLTMEIDTIKNNDEMLISDENWRISEEQFPKAMNDPIKISSTVLSPTSPLLKASFSPKNRDEFSPLNAPKIDQINKTKKDDFDVDDFIASDEFFDSDDFNARRKRRKRLMQNKKLIKSFFPVGYDPASTIPDDLFSSDDDKRNEMILSKFKKHPVEPVPVQKTKPKPVSSNKNSPLLNGSPLKKKPDINELDLVKAALSDEFKSDHKKRHKKKIIIIKEYSSSDNENDDQPNIVIEKRNEINRKSPPKEQNILNNKVQNVNTPLMPSRSPNKRFIFSDESFSDSGNEIETNRPTNQNSMRFTFSTNSNLSMTNTANNDRVDESTSTSDLNLSSTVEIPQNEIEAITSKFRVSKNVQTDSSMANSYENSPAISTKSNKRISYDEYSSEGYQTTKSTKNKSNKVLYNSSDEYENSNIIQPKKQNHFFNSSDEIDFLFDDDSSSEI